MKNKMFKPPVWLLLALLGAAMASAPASIARAQSGSLADAYKIIAAKHFVDLTHSFSPLTPVWKGFGQATFSAAADPGTGRPYTVEKDGFRAFFYSMVGQYGTHIDPPAHFDAERHDHGRNSGQADDPAVGGFRYHADTQARSRTMP